MTPGELIGRGKEAEVRNFGDAVIKLYPPGKGKAAVAREALALAHAAYLGLPVPAVHQTGIYDGRHGLVMERIDGPTMAALMLETPAEVPRLMNELVALQANILRHSGTGVPILKDKITRALELVFADPAERAAWTARLAALPDGQALCHGDFHPFNLMRRESSWVVLDWPDATAGPPAADVARTWLLLHLHDPALGRLYKDAVLARDLVSEREFEAWVPVMAAARIAEGVPDQVATLRALAGLRPAP